MDYLILIKIPMAYKLLKRVLKGLEGFLVSVWVWIGPNIFKLVQEGQEESGWRVSGLDGSRRVLKGPEGS